MSPHGTPETLTCQGALANSLRSACMGISVVPLVDLCRLQRIVNQVILVALHPDTWTQSCAECTEKAPEELHPPAALPWKPDHSGQRYPGGHPTEVRFRNRANIDDGWASQICSEH